VSPAVNAKYDDTTRFGAYLAQLLADKGIQQRDFAEAVGISEGEVSNMKAGRRPCPKDKVGDMIVALGLKSEEEIKRFKILAKISWLDPEAEEYVIRKMTPPTSDSSHERKKGPKDGDKK
jgi:transcriptional regulator with XRE-family HTH domain